MFFRLKYNKLYCMEKNIKLHIRKIKNNINYTINFDNNENNLVNFTKPKYNTLFFSINNYLIQYKYYIFLLIICIFIYFCYSKYT